MTKRTQKNSRKPIAPDNNYGLFGIFDVTNEGIQPVALVESNRAGAYTWIEKNGLFDQKYRVALMGEVEYVETVDDFPSGTGHDIEEVVRKVKPNVSASTKKNYSQGLSKKATAKSQPKGTSAQTVCPGSGVVFRYTFRGKKMKCGHCGRDFMINGNGKMRRHYKK